MRSEPCGHAPASKAPALLCVGLRRAAWVLTLGAYLICGPVPHAPAQAARNGPAAIGSVAMSPSADVPASLRARVAPPSAAVLRIYRESGAKGIGPHRLTSRDWAALDGALATLPQLHRNILQSRLRHLSFVDTPPGAGNALTSRVELAGGPPMFDLTLRAGLFRETLTEFLNGKENALFVPDGSGRVVHIEAGRMPALTYILLHEATHAVDLMSEASAAERDAIRAGVWLDDKGALAPPGDRSPFARNVWRGGARMPIGGAAGVYSALAASPFPSIYSATNAAEYLAEIVAWEWLSTRHGVKLRVEVRDAGGRPLGVYDPLASPMVRARFPAVQAMLQRHGG